MKIEIDLKIILLLIIFCFTSQIGYYWMFILFIFLHELAHIFVGLILGLKVSTIKMNIFGFSAELYEYKSRKTYKKVLTYLAGPMFNLICAIVFYFSNIKYDLAINLIYTNLMLFALNLFPILPLDGGKILKEILKKSVGSKPANLVMINVTKVSLIIISLIYSVLILKLKNIAILLLIIYLWYLYSIEAKKVNILKRVYEIIEKS